MKKGSKQSVFYVKLKGKSLVEMSDLMNKGLRFWILVDVADDFKLLERVT